MQITWIKNSNNQWYDLLRLNLSSIGDASGVYTIWHGGDNPRYVRIGSGEIQTRLSAHRNDRDIMAYQTHGLLVTWAIVPANQQLGAEAYLAERCNPLVGERFPDRTPIQINLPGENTP